MDALIERIEAMKRLEEDTESVDTNFTQSTIISDEGIEEKPEPFTIMNSVQEDVEGEVKEDPRMLTTWELRQVKAKIWLEKHGIR